jgi:hypothetical protein
MPVTSCKQVYYKEYRLHFWCVTTTILVCVDYQIRVKKGGINYRFGVHRLR